MSEIETRPPRPARSDRTPLHLRISADLAREIRSGAWAPGRRIPFEHELMATYGCARATAGKAVEALAAAGLIERRRRAGSFVTRPPLQSAVLEIPELQVEVERRGRVYAHELIARERRPGNADDHNEARLAAADGVLALTCLHLADGEPFALEQRVISLSAVPEALAVDFAQQAPGAWLLDHVPWTEAEHRITATAADTGIALRLGVDKGRPCLTLRRWTWRGGEPITFARQTFPAEAFEVVARFSPRTFGDQTSVASQRAKRT